MVSSDLSAEGKSIYTHVEKHQASSEPLCAAALNDLMTSGRGRLISRSTQVSLLLHAMLRRRTGNLRDLNGGCVCRPHIHASPLQPSK